MGAEDIALSVPVLDISALLACQSDAEIELKAKDKSSPESAPLQKLLRELHAAATDWGFFYISNHGVGENEIEEFRAFMRAFFALPLDVKNRIRRTKTNSRGFFYDELTKNKKDWKEVFDFGGVADDAPPGTKGSQRVQQDQNRWLDDEALPGFRAKMLEYYGRTQLISRRLLILFSLLLGKDATFFDQFFKLDTGELHTSSVIRLNHYPVSPDPENTMGVYHHTDGGVLTVLLQDDDVNSLQVFHRASQQWHRVPPRKHTFVVNIGDMLQIWSNDRFQAALHRVLSDGERDRFSAPFFYRTRLDAVIEPILQDEDEQPHYRPLKWHDFVLKRIEGNYADLGEEVQITQYRI